MINRQIRLHLFSLYTLLIAVVLSFAWYYGAKTVLNNIEIFKNSNMPMCQDVFNCVNGFSVFVNGASSFYVTVAAVLLSGLFLSGAFLYDKNSGFGNSCITRTGFNKYFSKKIISVFLSAFLSVAVILSVIFIACLFVYSAKFPSELFSGDMANAGITQFFFSHPYMVSFAVIFTVALYTSLFTVLGLCFSAFISNRFIISVMPFAVLLFFIIFPQLFSRQAAFAKYIAWIFPEYVTGFFLCNEFWYSKLPLLAVYGIHFLVLLVPIAVLFMLLYRKNRRQYIK